MSGPGGKPLSRAQWAVMNAKCPECGEDVGWKWSHEEIEITCRTCGDQVFPPDFVDHFNISPRTNPFLEENLGNPFRDEREV